MKRVVEAELGFIATVCPDGTPNLSPKGTTAVWDDTHLVFADIRSPGTVDNLRDNPSIEINVVDQLVRKGYRFKGTAEVHTDGELFERGRPVLRGPRHRQGPGAHPQDRDRRGRTSPAGHVPGLRPRHHRRRAAPDLPQPSDRRHAGRPRGMTRRPGNARRADVNDFDHGPGQCPTSCPDPRGTTCRSQATPVPSVTPCSGRCTTRRRGPPGSPQPMTFTESRRSSECRREQSESSIVGERRPATVCELQPRDQLARHRLIGAGRH